MTGKQHGGTTARDSDGTYRETRSAGMERIESGQRRDRPARSGSRDEIGGRRRSDRGGSAA